MLIERFIIYDPYCISRREKDKRRRELTGDKKRGSCYNSISRIITYIWKHTFAKIGEDWVFLAVLGVLMSVISFLMDFGIETCNHSRLWLYYHLGDHMALQGCLFCVPRKKKKQPTEMIKKSKLSNGDEFRRETKVPLFVMILVP